jgi:hypothetical protein
LEFRCPIHRESGERIFWNEIAEYLEQAKQAIDQWGKKRAELIKEQGGRKLKPKSILTFYIWKEIEGVTGKNNFRDVKKVLLGAGYRATTGSVRKCINRWNKKPTLPDKTPSKP